MKLKLYKGNTHKEVEVPDIQQFLAISSFIFDSLEPKLGNLSVHGSMSFVLNPNLTTNDEIIFSLDYYTGNDVIKNLGYVGIEVNQSQNSPCMLVSDKI